mmetsp:Transcript_3305/g.14414  ORF Transcript_3305/g.14414 Transcript_3305/m.14414 type:complete len:231 (-) Transcript_3305:3662-4354(-)
MSTKPLSMITPIMTGLNHLCDAIAIQTLANWDLVLRSAQCLSFCACCLASKRALSSVALCSLARAMTPSLSLALVYWSTSVDTNILAQKKHDSMVTMTKYADANGFSSYTGFLSTPTASIPVYMTSCQLSAVDVMNTTTSAWPMLSKWYSLLAQVPFSAKQSALVTTGGILHSKDAIGQDGSEFSSMAAWCSQVVRVLSAHMPPKASQSACVPLALYAAASFTSGIKWQL